MTNSTRASVHNPEWIYQGAGLNEAQAQRLIDLKYNPEMVHLLQQGLPISYGQDGQQVIEYPDGRRVAVREHHENTPDGQLQIRFMWQADIDSAPR